MKHLKQLSIAIIIAVAFWHAGFQSGVARSSNEENTTNVPVKEEAPITSPSHSSLAEALNLPAPETVFYQFPSQPPSDEDRVRIEEALQHSRSLRYPPGDYPPYIPVKQQLQIHGNLNSNGTKL